MAQSMQGGKKGKAVSSDPKAKKGRKISRRHDGQTEGRTGMAAELTEVQELNPYRAALSQKAEFVWNRRFPKAEIVTLSKEGFKIIAFEFFEEFRMDDLFENTPEEHILKV